jgi:hypothetical protein
MRRQADELIPPLHAVIQVGHRSFGQSRAVWMTRRM